MNTATFRLAVLSQNTTLFLPFPSSIRTTKYLLESVTASTAMPGYWSTGAWANSSPAGDRNTQHYITVHVLHYI